MIEIRFHGRGGQGAVTSAELLALAAIAEGKYAQGFPSFGPERRGAPVLAFARVNDRQIRLRSQIYEPDVVVVLDESLLAIQNPATGLKKTGMLLLNTTKTPQELRQEYGFQTTLVVVDANKIALEILGIPIVNTTMLGALIKATQVIPLESIEKPLSKRFGPLAKKNFAALQEAYKETVIQERES